MTRTGRDTMRADDTTTTQATAATAGATSPVSPEVEEDIRLVISAADPVSLFGPNAKRARIRYRRLARSVHPDANGGADGSDEAMRRLNALWESYREMTEGGGTSQTKAQAKAKTKTKETGDAKAKTGATGGGTKFVHELTRTPSVVLFMERGGWLVVSRKAGASPRINRTPERLADLASVVESSPVRMLEMRAEKTIRQADGGHAAISCDVPAFYDISQHLIPVAGIGGHLPTPTMAPEDVAWVAKRCLFFAAALRKAGLSFADGVRPADCVVIGTEVHVLLLVAPHLLEDAEGDRVEEAEHAVVTSLLGELLAATSDATYAGHRMRRFLEGAMADRSTDAASLVRELDDVCLDVFGKPRFHHMEVA